MQDWKTTEKIVGPKKRAKIWGYDGFSAEFCRYSGPALWSVIFQFPVASSLLENIRARPCSCRYVLTVSDSGN